MFLPPVIMATQLAGPGGQQPLGPGREQRRGHRQLRRRAPDGEADLRGNGAARLRLNELNSALVELVIANTSGGVDNTADDDGCNAIEAEILMLQARLAEIEGNQKEAQSRSEGLEEIFAMAGKLKGQPIEYDEKTVRPLLECVKVVSSEKLLMIFRGGIEQEVRMG